ncbi:MAG: hypothetical protein WC465_02665 [Patescibacteria group bacterium]
MVKISFSASKKWFVLLTIPAVFLFFPNLAFAEVSALAKFLGEVIHYLFIELPAFLLKKEMILLPIIAQYNNITNQPGVITAWRTLRDLANMFFIVILLIMSFATILQVRSYGYKALLRDLILYAILINFSRTIVSVLVDASQIVMLTFVAPIKDVVGSNVMAALGLYQIMQMTNNPEVTSNSFLMAMGLGAIMCIIAVVVIAVFIAMLVARIVFLWILTVTAPMAFLANAFPKTAYLYKDWENDLSKYLITGPAIAFFLWLAFTVVGNANISDSFNVPAELKEDPQVTETGAPSEVSQAAQVPNLINYVIAIAMLLGGLNYAAKAGVAGSGLAGKARGKINDVVSKAGRKVERGVTGAVSGTARGAVRLAWQGTSGEGGAKEVLSKMRASIGTTLADDNTQRLLRRTGLAGTALRAGRRMEAKENLRRGRKTAYFEKQMEGITDDEQRLQYAQSVGRGWGRREAAAVFYKTNVDNNNELHDIDPTRMTKEQLREIYGVDSVDQVDQNLVSSRTAQRYKDMNAAFQAAGDTASVEKLRTRSVAVHTNESLGRLIQEKGVGVLSRMDMSGLDNEELRAVMQRIMSQDQKALSKTVDDMEKRKREIFMHALGNVKSAGHLEGSLTKDDSDSAFYKAAMLQARFDGKNSDTNGLADQYKDLDEEDQKGFISNLRKIISGDEILKINNSTSLFKDMSGQANAGQRTQMKDKATDEQMQAVVQNQIRLGNIQMIMKDPVFGPIAQKNNADDVDAYFKVLRDAAGTLADKIKAANQNIEYGHKIFAGDKDGLYAWARTLKPADLIKIDDKLTLDDIVDNGKLPENMVEAMAKLGYGSIKPSAGGSSAGAARPAQAIPTAAPSNQAPGSGGGVQAVINKRFGKNK